MEHIVTGNVNNHFVRKGQFEALLCVQEPLGVAWDNVKLQKQKELKGKCLDPATIEKAQKAAMSFQKFAGFQGLHHAVEQGKKHMKENGLRKSSEVPYVEGMHCKPVKDWTEKKPPAAAHWRDGRTVNGEILADVVFGLNRWFLSETSSDKPDNGHPGICKDVPLGAGESSHWCGFAMGMNAFLNEHEDNDCTWSLATMATEKETDEVVAHFVFPELGVAVPLRNGDMIGFNPRKRHCLSARCNKELDAFCASFYMSATLGGGNRKKVPGGVGEAEKERAAAFARAVKED